MGRARSSRRNPTQKVRKAAAKALEAELKGPDRVPGPLRQPAARGVSAYEGFAAEAGEAARRGPKLLEHGSRKYGLTYTLPGSGLALSSEEEPASTGRKIATHAHNVARTALSPDGRVLATFAHDNDKPVRVWDIDSGDFLFSPALEFTGSVDFSFSPDSHVLLARAGPRVQLFDLSSGNRVGEPADRAAEDDLLSWSPDGSRIALFSNASGVVRFWAARSGAPLGRARLLPGTEQGYHEPRRIASHVMWSPCGSRLAVATATTLHRPFLGIDAPRLPDPPTEHSLAVFDLSPGAGAAKVWETAVSSADSRAVTAPAWSPDGKRLLWLAPLDGDRGSDDDGGVYGSDICMSTRAADTGAIVGMFGNARVPQFSASHVHEPLFSSDGGCFSLAGSIYDSASGREVVPVSIGMYAAMRWTSDGTRIISSGRAHAYVVRLPQEPAALLDAAAAELRQHLPDRDASRLVLRYLSLSATAAALAEGRARVLKRAASIAAGEAEGVAGDGDDSDCSDTDAEDAAPPRASRSRPSKRRKMEA